MKINKINLLSFLLMFFNIFLAFPFLVISILKKKESIFLISLFLGVMGFYFVPANDGYDIARYYRTFFDEIYRRTFFENQGGVVVENLVNVLVYLKLPPNLLPFISAFITYYFLLKTFQNYINKNNTSSFNYIFLFFMSYISIPIIGYTGIRSWMATSIFIFSILNQKNNYLRHFLIVVSVCIHTSMLIPGLIFYFSLFFEKEIKYNKILILFSIFLGIVLTPNNFINLIVEINKLDIIYISPSYILGKWGIGFIETRNTLISKLINSILLNLRFIIIFYFNVFLDKNTLKVDYKKRNFIILFSCCCFTLYRYFIFWERYTNILILIIFFISSSNYYKNNNIKYKIFNIFIMLYFILNLLYDLKKYYMCFFISYNNILKLSLTNMILKILDNYF